MDINAVIDAVAANVAADVDSDRPPISAKTSDRFTALKDTAAWRAAVEDLVDREAAAALRRIGRRA